MNSDYLNFCPRLKRMYESGSSTDKMGNAVPIAGISTLNNLRVIREIILKHRMSRTLEIGLAYGASTLAFLSSLKAVADDEFHHTAIDPFENSNFGGSALKVIEEEGFTQNFTHLEEFSSLVLPELARKKTRYQLIYIDGSHLFEDVFVDFYYSVMLLEAGGCLLLDDSTDKHVRKAIRFFQRNFDTILEPLDLGSFEDPQKSLKKRIGNKLGIRQLTGFRKVAEPPREWNASFKDF